MATPLILRHALKNPHMFEIVLNSFSSRLESILNSLQERPENLGVNAEEAYRQAVYACVLDKPKSQIVRLFDLAVDFGVAHFISACDLHSDYAVIYNNKEYAYGKKTSRAFISSTDWLRTVYMAVVLRNKPALDVMLQIPTSVLREGNVKEDDVDYLHVDFIKGLFNPQANIGDLLINVMEATDPSNVTSSRQSFILNIRVPELSLYQRFLSKDEASFNEKLTEALQWHQEFWGNVKRAQSLDGWISLPLLMAMTLAKTNKKFSFSVASDYAPQWLVNGDF